MKTNFGKHEVILKNNSLLVTETNNKGIIKFASKDFCSISGYTRAELLGSPHNLIRHPFMPAEVFKDLWQTLQSGNTWTGLIINHTKDGGYYWVKANVFISQSSDGSIKYISVRIKPTAEDIDEAIKLYQNMA